MRDPMRLVDPGVPGVRIQVRIHIFFFPLHGQAWCCGRVHLLDYMYVSWGRYRPADGGRPVRQRVVARVRALLRSEARPGGDAREILIWPWAGLAFTEIPHRWKPLFVTASRPAPR